MDLTALSAEPTGREKTLDQLRQLDPVLGTIPGLDVVGMQAPMLRALDQLGPAVPEPVRRGLETALEAARYGCFCWRLNVVSLLWSLTTVELALRYRLEKHRSRCGLRALLEQCAQEGILLADTQIVLDLVAVSYDQFHLEAMANRRVHGDASWRMEPPRPANSLAAIVDGLPFLRNHLAHNGSDHVLHMGSAQRGFLQAIEIIKQLW